MRCPICDHENNDLSTRCAACGSVLPQDDVNTTPDADGTAEHPQPREVDRAADKPVAPKQHRVLGFLRAHDRALGIGIALLVVLAMGIVWVVLSMTNTPSYQQIEQDMAELAPMYGYTGGDYGADSDIPLSRMTVTKREATRAPEDLDLPGGVGSNAYNVEAEATYDGEHVRVVRDFAATYVRSDDGWVITGDLSELSSSRTPKTGVDEDKVIENIGSILTEASLASGASLTQIYDGGDFSISSNDFDAKSTNDAATDDVVIDCQKNDGFCAYSGAVTAHFAFESGEWRLRSASADGEATMRSFKPLEGTWVGNLVDQSAIGGKCFGAQDVPVRVTIESVGDASLGTGQVKGTISCLVHNHERLERDADSTIGDEELESFPFAGTITTTYDAQTGSSLNIACTTSGTARGEVEFTLSFGTDDDPSAATARVVSSHTYETTVMYLFPGQEVARFTDTYALTKG